MASGDQIMREWLDKVEPRIRHIRNAYLATGVLEELMKDAKDICDDWEQKATAPDPVLAQQAKDELEAVKAVHETYRQAYQQLAEQMGRVRSELNKLQDQRLTLSAMCQTLNIEQLGVETLQKVYEAIGPDSSVNQALDTARRVVVDLDAEAKARQELQDFLANSMPAT